MNQILQVNTGDLDATVEAPEFNAFARPRTGEIEQKEKPRT
jgi:hypothetical protein